MQHYITVYLVIGMIFTVLFDMLLRYGDTQEPLSIPEFLLSICFWPGILAIYLKNVLNK